MRFTFELVLALLGYGLAAMLLNSSLRLKRRASGAQVLLPRNYAAALLAWLPVRVCTYYLWHPLTGHWSRGYPTWYWLLLALGVVLSVTSFLTSRWPSLRTNLARLVSVIGLALVVTPLFGIGWFKAQGVHHTALWLGTLLLLAAAMILGVVWLRFRRSPKASPTRGKSALGAAALVVAALATIGLVAQVLPSGGSGSNYAAAATAPSGSPTTKDKPADPPYHQRTPSQCDAGFNVKYDNNEKNDLVSGGAPRDKYPTAQSAIKKLTGVMKHDSRVLYVYYITSPEQKLSPIQSEKQLRGTGVNDGCYSAKGQQVYNAMLAELAHAKVKNVKAPAYGVNTGAYPGGAAFQEAAGPIGGNLDGVQIVYENGGTVYALRRCLNAEVPGKIPHLPPKPPTPSPTPPGHTPSPCTKKEAPKGYKIVNCKLVKTPCVDANGQKCGPNPPYQPPSSKPNGPTHSKPGPLPTGPGGTQAPPPPNSSGYDPGPSGAPGGGASHGGSTTVKPPKPNPTPSQAVPTTDPVATGTPQPPG